jgi:hypothetical protein
LIGNPHGGCGLRAPPRRADRHRARLCRARASRSVCEARDAIELVLSATCATVLRVAARIVQAPRRRGPLLPRLCRRSALRFPRRIASLCAPILHDLLCSIRNASVPVWFRRTGTGSRHPFPCRTRPALRGCCPGQPDQSQSNKQRGDRGR